MKECISVVIPVFNSSSYINKTIDSVIKNVGEIDLEIILVDDCSSDLETLKRKISNYRCVQLFEKNKKTNASHSRNIGFGLSKSNYVFFLDSDDLYADDYLISRLALMKSTKSGVIFGGFYKDNGEKISPNNDVFYTGIDMRYYIFIMSGDFRSSTISINKKNHKGSLFDPMQFKHQDWGFGIICYDNGENIGYDKSQKVYICENRHSQMSSKMNLPASKYFFEKYLVESKYRKSFVMKHYYRAALNNEKETLDFFEQILNKIDLKIKDKLKIAIFKTMTRNFIGKLIKPILIQIKKNREYK